MANNRVFWFLVSIFFFNKNESTLKYIHQQMIDSTLMTHNKSFRKTEKRPFFNVLNHGIVCNVIIVCTVQWLNRKNNKICG